MERSALANPITHPGEVKTPPCDRCDSNMTPTGWVPQPDGRGGLRRIIVYRCDGCGRLYDPYWGFRVMTGSL